MTDTPICTSGGPHQFDAGECRLCGWMPESNDATAKQLDELRAQLEAVIGRLQAAEERAKATAEWETEWRDLRRREVRALERIAANGGRTP